MTDNQFKQLVDKLNEFHHVIEPIDAAQTKPEVNISELKIELEEVQKEVKQISKSIGILADDLIRTRAKIAILEDQQELLN